MLKLLTCARGHFWEQPDEGTADCPVCPECGAPADTLPLLDLVSEQPCPSLPPPVAQPLPDLFDANGRPIILGYEILEDLGRTLTGVRVYKAKQAIINRPVLLSVVAAREDASQHAWGSLRGTASALGKLAHPNIVLIHESGERDRQLFYNATQLVDGPNLVQKVAGKPLPFKQIIRLMELLARAIDYAHQQGLLHRNLRPSSVLLQPVDGPTTSRPNSPVLGDPPGAACMLHSRCYIPRLTDFGHVRRPIEGDPTDVDLYGEQTGYLSPEQAWGRARDIGPTTDVYGLGAILYFLLTGRPPFRGPTLPDVLDTIQTADLVPPRDIRSVPADLNNICCKCLARQPRRRYATAGALADDLRRAELGLPLVGRPTSGAARVGKWVRRWPAVTAFLLMVLLGVITTSLAYHVGLSEGNSSGDELMAARVVLPRLRDEVEAARRELRQLREREQFVVYRQKIAQAEQELKRDAARAGMILDSCAENQRGLEWHYLKACTIGRGKTKLAGFQQIVSVAFHPQENQTLCVVSSTRGRDADTRRGLVQLWNVSTQTESLKLNDFFGPVHGVAFARDGQALATVSTDPGDTNGQARLWELEADGGLGVPVNRAQMLWSVDFPNKRATGVAFSPDGGTVAVATAGGLLTPLLRANGMQLGWTWGQEAFDPNRKMDTRVSWPPPGERLVAFTGGENHVRLWNAIRGQGDLIIPAAGNILDVAVGGQWVAVANAGRTITLHNRPLGDQAFLLGPLPRRVVRLAFNASGTRLAGACDDGTIHVWAFAGGTSAEVLTLQGTGTHGLAFSSSGKGLATAGPQDVTVWGAEE